MAKHGTSGQELSISAARQQLACLQVPWYEFEQAVHEVTKANPNEGGEALVQKIIDAVMKHWGTGIGCC